MEIKTLLITLFSSVAILTLHVIAVFLRLSLWQKFFGYCFQKLLNNVFLKVGKK